MADFQPRLEQPPKNDVDRGSPWDTIRAFVRAANGQWCLISEQPNVKKKQRKVIWSKTWGAFMRRTGFESTGFELHAVTVEGCLKMYARFIAANVVKCPQ